MKIKVLFFGELAEIAGIKEITLENLNTTTAVNDNLQSLYPAFKIRKYSIALNKQLIRSQIDLNDGDEIAILPPFSGG